MPYNKVIFVDSDGTCRSAMIRIIMKSKFLLYPVEFESRGMVVLFPEPLDAKAYAVLDAYGYALDDIPARQLMQEDIKDDVLILTMEDRQKLKIWETFENARHVYTLAEFIHYSGDILPLYGEPVESYEEWVVKMDRLLDELVIHLNELSIRDGAAGKKKETQPERGVQSQQIGEIPENGYENSQQPKTVVGETIKQDKEEIPDGRKKNGLSDLG